MALAYALVNRVTHSLYADLTAYPTLAWLQRLPTGRVKLLSGGLGGRLSRFSVGSLTSGGARRSLPLGVLSGGAARVVASPPTFYYCSTPSHPLSRGFI